MTHARSRHRRMESRSRIRGSNELRPRSRETKSAQSQLPPLAAAGRTRLLLVESPWLQAEREAQQKAKELAEAQRQEEKLLYLAHEEQWST